MSSSAQPQPPQGGDVSRAPMLLAVSWTMVAVDIIVVSLRMFVRYSKRSIGMEDYFMVIAMFLFIATIAVVNMIVEMGLGRHVYYIPPQNYEPFLKWVFILQSFTFFTLAFAKGSLVLLIIRLMGKVSAWRERLLWAHMGFFFLLTILSTIFNFIACRPMKASWMPNLPGASCWPIVVNRNWAIAITAFSSYFDFVLAIIPITIIWNMRLAPKKKFGMSILLGLGILAGIAAAVKGSLTIATHVDFTWDAATLYVWSEVEYFLNIFCGCVALLKPLYDNLVHGKPILPAEGSSGRSMFYGNSSLGSSMRSIRFRLRNTSRESGSKSSQQNDSLGTRKSAKDENIVVEETYDIERRPKGSTEHINNYDFLHRDIAYIPR